VRRQRQQHQRGREVVQQVRQDGPEHRHPEQREQPVTVRRDPVGDRAEPAAADRQHHHPERQDESAEGRVRGQHQRADPRGPCPLRHHPGYGKHERPGQCDPRRVHAQRTRRAEPEQRHTSTTSATALGLSERERQVAELIAAGMTNEETAKRLYLSPKTVEAHLSRVNTKLNVRSRMDLLKALNR
jgi:DNA-binding CsgD family transcriptional regulator